jgi:hypothetical protein
LGLWWRRNPWDVEDEVFPDGVGYGRVVLLNFWVAYTPIARTPRVDCQWSVVCAGSPCRQAGKVVRAEAPAT